MFHGKKRTKTLRFSNNTFAFRTEHFCGKHGFWVDTAQWESEHENCREVGNDLIGGAGRALPVTRRFSRLKVFRRAA